MAMISFQGIIVCCFWNSGEIPFAASPIDLDMIKGHTRRRSDWMNSSTVEGSFSMTRMIATSISRSLS